MLFCNQSSAIPGYVTYVIRKDNEKYFHVTGDVEGLLYFKPIKIEDEGGFDVPLHRLINYGADLSFITFINDRWEITNDPAKLKPKGILSLGVEIAEAHRQKILSLVGPLISS